MHGKTWDVDECTACSCDSGTVTCVTERCQPAFCASPVIPEGECCLLCPYNVVVKKVRPEITNGDTFTEEGDNQISVNVSIKFHDATDTTGVSGEDLWKLSAWASANPDGNGPRIGFEEDILDLKQKDQDLKRTEKIEFTDLDFSFSDPMAECVDTKYICVRIERGDDPRTTGYIGYTLGGYPGPNAQTGCTRAPECRRSQDVVVKKVRPEITNGDTFTEEGDNQISVNVSIKFDDAAYTTGVLGEDLWKLSAWASANPDGNGPRIGFEEDILDLKQKDQSLTRREKIEFTNLDFSFSDPMAECVDMKYICVRIERGDNPRTTEYIGYTLGGYPGPSAQTGCTRAPECRRSQALTDVVVKKVRPEITNGDTSTEEGDNQISINVSIKFHDATDTTGVSGEDLWKLSAWASANPDGNGPRIGFEEDILDLKQKDQSLKRRERIEFTNLDFSFSDPMAKCVDMKYICVRIERGDNPRTTGYIGYTLGGYPGPSAQTGCTRAPECRRSQDVVVKKVRPKITNGDTFREEGDNQISVNVSIKFHDATDTTGVSGEDLWKLSAWASANPDGNGPRIGFEEDILDLKQKDQSLKRRERIEFTNLDFSFSDPMAKCVDMKYICVRIERGDNPRTTGYIGYTLGGYPGPNAQTGCTRAPECRRSQGTNLFRSLLSKAFQHTRK
ncbi:uncharacterized protein LOC121421273 isoform X4 [Lytechinus variegatus]|uniref:uncharacterized protein LOC121421273 isoform X4 n=1 Tax=Lytechinus variegatus TaxID=7654 RepID=UPI001BB118A9|nr:uncharacterized protein LOC121421273 isoform X4 [Lytechinus variegatus]